MVQFPQVRLAAVRFPVNYTPSNRLLKRSFMGSKSVQRPGSRSLRGIFGSEKSLSRTGLSSAAGIGARNCSQNLQRARPAYLNDAMLIALWVRNCPNDSPPRAILSQPTGSEFRPPSIIKWHDMPPNRPSTSQLSHTLLVQGLIEIGQMAAMCSCPTEANHLRRHSRHHLLPGACRWVVEADDRQSDLASAHVDHPFDKRPALKHLVLDRIRLPPP